MGEWCGQDLSRFLVADLGIMRYPAYTVRRSRPVWPDRASLLAYEAALGQAEALDTALEVQRPFRHCMRSRIVAVPAARMLLAS